MPIVPPLGWSSKNRQGEVLSSTAHARQNPSERPAGQHRLLYTDARQENYAAHLVAFLRRQHPDRDIKTELLPLTDVIDLAEVKTKVETWLLAHREDELALFFSPGTSIMQLAWYICHTPTPPQWSFCGSTPGWGKWNSSATRTRPILRATR